MNRARFLTVKQPHASLIMAGQKDVENRTKAFPSTVDLPARVWIHAGKGADRDALRRLPARYDGIFFRYGVLLGHVTVTGSHHARDCIKPGPEEGSYLGPCSAWATDGVSVNTPWRGPVKDIFHWCLEDPVVLPSPIPMKGMLGLPFLPDDVQAAAYAQLQGVAA